MCGTWTSKLVWLLVCAAAGQEASRPFAVWSERLERLNRELLASRSATLTLEKWCGELRLASPARVVARVVTGDRREPDAEQLRRLQVRAPGEVRYRRVELRCGSTVLSAAENWYVPARLTAEMNRELETTDRPFGRVVLPLTPRRETISSEVLWRPPDELPEAVLEHRALVLTGEGKPFSEVRERYQRVLMVGRE